MLRSDLEEIVVGKVWVEPPVHRCVLGLAYEGLASTCEILALDAALWASGRESCRARPVTVSPLLKGERGGRPRLALFPPSWAPKVS